MAVYVEDKYQLGVREWFEDTNPQAMAQITERMIEAIRKGYWTADEETLRKLVEVYSEVAGHHDVVTDNRVFTDFVAEQAAGFGLTLASMAPEVASAALMPSAPSPTVEPPKAQAEPQNTPSETVTGQKLEERVQPPAPPAPPQYFALIPLVLIGFGFLWQGAALALRRDSTQVGDVV
jgi:cobaltochelatase CobN